MKYKEHLLTGNVPTKKRQEPFLLLCSPSLLVELLRYKPIFLRARYTYLAYGIV